MNLNITVGQAAYADYCVVIPNAHWLRPMFVNRTYCCVSIRRKHLWLFVFEMHLINA